MQATQLSILVPSRQEMFLSKTIENILENIEADTEIIAVLDGDWSDPPVPQHERVNIIYVSEAIGQRAATSLACKLSKARYVMKVDAHCAFDKGFDRKMLEGFEKMGDCTMVPILKNLWGFDWQCEKCGSRWYQGPTPTRCMTQTRHVIPNEACDGKKFKRIITWAVEGGDDSTARKNWKGRYAPQHSSFCFDSEPHFQYFSEYAKRPETLKMKEETGGFTETMSLQGSCWTMPREKYLEYIPFREQFGSWGNEGIEIACREWLTGGKVICNQNTWYGHLFRTQGGDFNFPYPQSGRGVDKTKKAVKEAIWNKKLPGQIHPVSWLVERFAPVPGWTK